PPIPTPFPYTTLFRSFPLTIPVSRGYRWRVDPQQSPFPFHPTRAKAQLFDTDRLTVFPSPDAGYPLHHNSYRIELKCESLRKRRDRKSTRLNSSHVKI